VALQHPITSHAFGEDVLAAIFAEALAQVGIGYEAAKTGGEGWRVCGCNEQTGFFVQNEVLDAADS
jgi:hypothetical protein